jgi:hypothetical protein
MSVAVTGLLSVGVPNWASAAVMQKAAANVVAKRESRTVIIQPTEGPATDPFLMWLRVIASIAHMRCASKNLRTDGAAEGELDAGGVKKAARYQRGCRVAIVRRAFSKVGATVAFQPKAAFLRFALVHRADLKAGKGRFPIRPSSQESMIFGLKRGDFLEISRRP